MSRRTARIVTAILCSAAVLCLVGAALIDERRELDVCAVPATVELGVVEPQTSHRCMIVLNNVGRLRVHLPRVRTTCGCTIAEVSPRFMDPGEKSMINVTVTVGTEAGAFVRTVHAEIVTDNHSLRSIIAIPIRLTVRPSA